MLPRADATSNSDQKIDTRTEKNRNCTTVSELRRQRDFLFPYGHTHKEKKNFEVEYLIQFDWICMNPRFKVKKMKFFEQFDGARTKRSLEKL